MAAGLADGCISGLLMVWVALGGEVRLGVWNLTGVEEKAIMGANPRVYDKGSWCSRVYGNYASN